MKDQSNVMDYQQRHYEGLRELALFAGAGGGILGGTLLGWETVCAVEWNEYAAAVLCARQNEGFLPPFPIWDDVQSFDGKPWRGLVDVVSGGFPCQDISSAGSGAGIEGERSSMWKHMARIIGEVRPRYAFMENSPMLTSRGLGVVLGDLAVLGYDAEWGCLSGSQLGANHERDRIWIVSANTDMPQRERGCLPIGVRAKHANACNSRWWKDTSPLHRVDDGVAFRVDRLKAIGNGQIPPVAASAFIQLANRFKGMK